ncbi:hypothetical protein ACFOQM_08505 [Paenibacillus sp. GCM10012307]|uniref:hypothetical protein n=1 Tax=Paenibacillus sp. GCM10012307 TaxID=3317343 RepID=UPI00361FAB4E
MNIRYRNHWDSQAAAAIEAVFVFFGGGLQRESDFKGEHRVHLSNGDACCFGGVIHLAKFPVENFPGNRHRLQKMRECKV